MTLFTLFFKLNDYITQRMAATLLQAAPEKNILALLQLQTGKMTQIYYQQLTLYCLTVPILLTTSQNVMRQQITKLIRQL